VLLGQRVQLLAVRCDEGFVGGDDMFSAAYRGFHDASGKIDAADGFNKHIGFTLRQGDRVGAQRSNERCEIGVLLGRQAARADNLEIVSERLEQLDQAATHGTQPADRDAEPWCMVACVGQPGWTVADDGW